MPPKETLLLDLLLSLDGSIATHAMIEATVWPRQQVSYASLTRCVYSLRRILDEDDTIAIQTIPRKGYRLHVTSSGEAVTARQSDTNDRSPAARRAASHHLSGLQEAHSPVAQTLRNALEEFELALQEDPGYAPAYVGIAEVRMYQVLRGQVPATEGLNKGIEACKYALHLQPESAPALAVKAWFVGVMLGDNARARALFRRAENLDPDHSRIYSYRSWHKRTLGDVTGMLRDAERARQLQPRDLLNRHAHAWSLFLAGRAPEALALEVKLAAESPLDEVAHGYVALMATYLERYEQALTAAEKGMTLDGANPALHAIRAYMFARAGRNNAAQTALELATGALGNTCSGALIAPAQLALGDHAAALRSLQAARDAGCPWFRAARLDPRLAVLARSGVMDYLYNQPPGYAESS